MNSWNKKISIRLLKSIALCFFLANIHAEEIAFTPSKEVHQLDTIKLNFDIPMIDASNTLVSFSSFEDLLTTQIISLPNKAYTITWQVKNPKKQLPLPCINSEAAVKKLSPNFHRIDPSASIELTKKSYIQKNFFDDIISNLQQAKEHQNIRAIFYPDDRITYTDDLQERLTSSLEFKVLAFTKPKEFVTNIPLEDPSLKKVKLISSIITKDPLALSPHKSNLFEEKGGLCSEELYKQEQSLTALKEEEPHEVDLNDLSIPEILTGMVNVYTYRPGFSSEAFNVEQMQLVYIEKGSLKPLFTSLLPEISNKPFALKPLTIVKVIEKDLPTPLSLPYITPLSVKKIENKKEVVNKYCFNTDPKSATTPLPTRLSELSQKTFFVEAHQNVLCTGTLVSIEPPQFDKNGQPIKSNTPTIEVFFKPNAISLPVIIKKDGTKHAFTADSLAYIPKDHLRKKGYYTSIKDSAISDQKRLNEFPRELYDQTISQHEYLDAFYLEKEVFPEKEQIQTAKTLSVILVKENTKNPVDGVVAFYPLESNRVLTLSESELGHLIENVNAVFSKDIPDYTKDEKLAHFVNRSLNIAGDQKEEQKAVNIAFKMPYDQLNSDQIHSSIKPKVADALHPFKADVTHVGFFDQMERVDDVIVAEKEVISVEIPINYSSEKELVIQTKDLKVISPFQALLPYSSKNISLQDQLPINNAQFRGEISLPKIMTINKENSFFLNPMLSLIDSTAFNEDYTKSGDPSLVNRANRMTQYFLFNLPSLDELHTDSFPEAFNLETRLLLGDAGTANDFACTIKTSEKDILEPLPVHILYILDTSSSIEPHRFGIFKEAIATSLEQLDPNSTFNIAILSKGKVEMLHEQNPHPTTSSKGYAKRYLRKITQSSQTSFKDLISLLEKEKTLALQEITHRSCLILSDGKFASNIRIDRKLLQTLTAIEAGNFSIYTASVSDKNNTSMLSLLAKLNHGFSLYTRTHSSFSRKFSILLKHIKHPLIHDVMISFPDDDGALAYVSDQVSPILLADKEFTFYGNSKSGRNSRVFIQGRSGDRWINILKELPLNSARNGRSHLKKKLVTQKSILSLQSFVDTKDENYLLQAKEYSKEFDISLPVP